MTKRRAILALLVLAIAAGTVVAGLTAVPGGLLASSHREAPITALDTKADITDIYAFRSYDANGNDTNPPSITIIMCVDPFLEPANGPNWFPFDPGVLYEINIDNNNSGKASVRFQFRFHTTLQAPQLYTALAGFGSNPNGTNGVVPDQITDFSNPGLNLLQNYIVTMFKGSERTPISGSQPLYAVPANAGPRTINYAALYEQGTYTNVGGTGISVFAGTVDDPFFIDLGGTFDTANLRTGSSGVPGVMTAAEDATNGNFAADTVSGYAVNAIAIQVPISMLASTGNVEPPTSPHATIGIWATTSRGEVTVLPEGQLESRWRQVQRLGNPLINELVIGTGSKDYWSMSPPYLDSQFAHFDLNPVFVKAVDALYGVLAPGALYSPPPPRVDLLPLVQYVPPIAASGTPTGPIADLLRLNTGVLPTAPGSANRLGLLGGDGAGYPNGRRLADDVVDITLRVAVGGVLAGDKCGSNHQSACNVFPNNILGDGVNVNDVNSDFATDGATNLVEPNTHFHTSFPYVDYCPSGRNRVHKDPGEPYCTDGGAPINCKVN
jgi:hypothetical protein